MLDARVRRVLDRLEAEDERDQALGVPHGDRSLQIAPTTGGLLYMLCVGRPGCSILEIGGSRGYSTIWLGAAARVCGGRVTSLEADPRKLKLSLANIAEAGLDGFVEIVHGDAFATLSGLAGPFGFVFLDAWKDDYERLFAHVRPLLAPGAVLAADNVLSHATTLAFYSAARQADPGLVSVTVPLDSGLELTTDISSLRPS